MNRHIIITEDGSHSLYLPEMDEHYHSVHGAIQESKHVFIESGLNHCPKQTINVFEVGFGSGLNALLTLIEAEAKNISINYYSIEKYPLTPSEFQTLNYAHRLNIDNKLLHDIHECEWDIPTNITHNFVLHKIKNDLIAENLENIPFFDVVFFDAFAPNKQPDLWTEKIYSKIFAHCKNEAIFVTYCVKGVVRRGLQETGFRVERIPGPPGKKEMLRAFKQ
jgi:tRNA U34 5-methylaminomethyl-2-thiouridine-forming methyltransferase MnmC